MQIEKCKLKKSDIYGYYVHIKASEQCFEWLDSKWCLTGNEHQIDWFMFLDLAK